ncbi:MAG: hypothetical protein KTR26_01950 [Flammeovirgaceae bacterium]|nr:hypothetical protein [Flammeovirgaceae bacterium]
MKSPYYFTFLFILFTCQLKAQNCTIYCSDASPCTIDWDNMLCDETGSAPVVGDEIIITDGVTVEVTDNNEAFNGNLRIESGGILDFPSSSDKLDLTNGSSGCGRSIIIESGGKITGGSASNQLRICGTTIGKGGGGCIDDPADPPSIGDSPPYCLDGNGLNGEVGLDENGVNTGLLPIELVSFSREHKNGGIMLNWTTASEINFSHFELHYSTDGYQFKKIAQIQGKNLGTGRNEYTFLHSNVLSGNHYYYRLKNIDLDSTYSYSKVIVGTISNKKKIDIFPTYNKHGGQLSLNFPQKTEKAEVFFYTLSGRIAYNEILENISKGLYQFHPKSALKPNSYIIEIITDKKQVTRSIIIIE